MKFRQAITSKTGALTLTRGTNGAIYGALTFVSIPNEPGWFLRGPGETLLFSVTNKKVLRYVGTTAKPITVHFDRTFSHIGFSDGNENWGLVYKIFDDSRTGESYSGSRPGFQGF